MNTSRKNFTLSKPEGSNQIPLGTLGYFRARHRGRVYELVLNEFKDSGLTQADLARRLGGPPEVVCRLLGSPGNWTLNTVSDLLFAINGGEVNYSISYALGAPSRNFDMSDWLADEQHTGASDTTSTNFPVEDGRQVMSG